MHYSLALKTPRTASQAYDFFSRKSQESTQNLTVHGTPLCVSYSKSIFLWSYFQVNNILFHHTFCQLSNQFLHSYTFTIKKKKVKQRQTRNYASQLKINGIVPPVLFFILPLLKYTTLGASSQFSISSSSPTRNQSTSSWTSLSWKIQSSFPAPGHTLTNPWNMTYITKKYAPKWV